MSKRAGWNVFFERTKSRDRSSKGRGREERDGWTENRIETPISYFIPLMHACIHTFVIFGQIRDSVIKSAKQQLLLLREVVTWGRAANRIETPISYFISLMEFLFDARSIGRGPSTVLTLCSFH